MDYINAILGFLGILIVIALSWVIIFGIVVVPTYTVLGLHAVLKYLGTNCFIGLDKLFFPGFDAPVLAVWSCWGFVAGAAIQGCREMLIFGRKGIGALVALAPILLLGLNGIVKDVDLPASSGGKTTAKVEQTTSGSKTNTVKRTKPTSVATKQTATGSERNSVTRMEPVRVTTEQETVPPLPTKRREPVDVATKQNTVTTSTTLPRRSTSSVPSDMVLIPAGEFQMGSSEGTDEKPVHAVYIDAFYMDEHEVTNAEYKRFLDANPRWRKNRIPTVYHDGDYLKHWNGNNYPSGKGEHPVTYVSWYGAMAYAKSVGKRLPTEAEWEKAARGGLEGEKYPWGSDIDSTKANYGKKNDGTTRVGRYSPNGYGLYDMSGNVLEWCLDAYDKVFYGRSARQNPIAGGSVSSVTTDFSKVGTQRVLRGGSWSVLSQSIRVADRAKGDPKLSYFGVGFRCVKDVSH